jgi:hypothetical protein
MVSAVKSFAHLSRSVVSVSNKSLSNKLSIVAVLGCAALALLPYNATSGLPGTVPVAQDSTEPTFQLVARRSRTRRELPSEASPEQQELSSPRSAASHKISSISQPEPGTLPSPPAAEVQPGETTPSDVWSETQVIAALRECIRLLAPIAAEVEVSEPLKQDQCGTPAPVVVRRIGSGANKVEISPPAVVNCPMVVRLHAWVEKALQPAAQEAFGARIARLRGASGYACRNRVGSHFHADRLSEHAFANAIDIAGFITTDGRTIDVAGSWGPTVRDQEAQRVAAARAKENAPAADKTPELAKAGRQRDHKISAIAIAASDKPKPTSVQTAELQSRGKATSDMRASTAPGHEDAGKSAEAQFLRRLHKSACEVFGTVLGPEANAAHRDHFHLDLAHRRHSAYCQ